MSARPCQLSDDVIQELRADLRQLQRDLTEAALAEALRLLESPRFEQLTEQHVREVAEYRAIEIAGEHFFQLAFSRSKEAGAMLGFARLLGPDSVRDDLTRLRGSIRDRSAIDPLRRPSPPRRRLRRVTGRDRRDPCALKRART